VSGGGVQAWDEETGSLVDYPDVDSDYDPRSDSPLLDPGSDGLITQGGPQLLMELARRRDQGASLAQLRRDAGCIDPFVLSDRTLHRAVDQGARLAAYEDTGRIPARLSHRWYRGVDVRACPVCGRRVLSRALRPRGAGCALCTEGL
jgi:hypothetical protein